MTAASSARAAPPAKWPARMALALAAALLAALLAFLHLGSEMTEGETRSFDSGLLLALRRPEDLNNPIGPAWLKIMILDLTSLGSTAVLTLVTILVIGLVLCLRNWRSAAFIAAATGGGAALSGLLKLDYARPRPALVSHLVDVSSASFPSGHAMNSAIVYLTLGLLGARAVTDRLARHYIVTVAVLLTLIVGATRVYLGVHWPTDVLAGWSAGAAWALLCWGLAELMRRRGSSFTPDSGR